ncbi:MAG TPA: exodeoxyribonuclease III [Halothiobacillaceae bacterium]|nr:exodeoxyribonuclease III [Halothiobacillaceae bacterium]
MFEVASWNVNSLKVRLPQVLDWLSKRPATLLGLQELKQVNEAVDIEKIEQAGYRILANGQKTYNGVAWIYPQNWSEPTDVITDIPGFDDPQRRVLAASFGSLRAINLYVVNGEAVGSEKFEYKLAWLNALHDWLASEIAAHEQLVVLGDFNIAPEDRDVHDPQAWAGKVLCSEPERNALEKIIALGLVDSFRLFEQPEQSFSWWDYRAAAFRRNHGLRIDLILLSQTLAKKATAAGIDIEPRQWPRPSDHAPAWVELNQAQPAA